MIWLSPSDNAQSPRIWDACEKLPANKVSEITDVTHRETYSATTGGYEDPFLCQCTTLLDRVHCVYYATHFDLVRFAGLRGRILCRNAHFNRRCAAVIRRTAFARA